MNSIDSHIAYVLSVFICYMRLNYEYGTYYIEETTIKLFLSFKTNRKIWSFTAIDSHIAMISFYYLSQTVGTNA